MNVSSSFNEVYLAVFVVESNLTASLAQDTDPNEAGVGQSRDNVPPEARLGQVWQIKFTCVSGLPDSALRHMDCDWIGRSFDIFDRCTFHNKNGGGTGV